MRTNVFILVLLVVFLAACSHRQSDHDHSKKVDSAEIEKYRKDKPAIPSRTSTSTLGAGIRDYSQPGGEGSAAAADMPQTDTDTNGATGTDEPPTYPLAGGYSGEDIDAFTEDQLDYESMPSIDGELNVESISPE